MKYREELTKIDFLYTDGNNKDFALLCDKLDHSLDEFVGNKFERSQYAQYNQTDSIRDVIVVYRQGEPVACGGFKMYDSEHAELKRIFTDVSCRGMGMGAEVLRRLEEAAKMKGYQWCILETGEPLAAACHLYKKAGYKVIENYGQYKDMQDSICMGRKI